jgi:hypothetical protein
LFETSSNPVQGVQRASCLYTGKADDVAERDLARLGFAEIRRESTAASRSIPATHPGSIAMRGGLFMQSSRGRDLELPRQSVGCEVPNGRCVKVIAGGLNPLVNVRLVGMLKARRLWARLGIHPGRGQADPKRHDGRLER